SGELVTVPHNVAASWGIAHVPGHESAQLARLHVLWDQLSPLGTRVLELFDLEWLIVRRGSAPAGAEALGQLGGAQLLHVQGGDRLRLIDRVRIGRDDQALTILTAPEVDVRREAVVAPSEGAHELAGTGATGSCRYASFAPEQVALDCQVRGGEALLMMAE